MTTTLHKRFPSGSDDGRSSNSFRMLLSNVNQEVGSPITPQMKDGTSKNSQVNHMTDHAKGSNGQTIIIACTPTLKTMTVNAVKPLITETASLMNVMAILELNFNYFQRVTILFIFM
mmetsp:Transcript_18983/g.26725  ORF Transcript_18983/g.26725 Transcript_18983/m.26725 type:complete len:117 (+) Transcript_18983:1304-1654(+)